MPEPLAAIVLACLLAGHPVATGADTAPAQPSGEGAAPYLRTPSAPAERSLLREAPLLMLQPLAAPETVYLPPRVADTQLGFNEGALSLDLHLRYMTDYIFRGLEVVEPAAAEDAFNIQLEAGLRMDLGRLPDPFLRIFTNSARGDDISNFQVIRPAFGLQWDVETFSLAVGLQSFTYPNRTDLDTSEIFADLRFNDGVLIGEEGPLLGPFIFAAWDYDRFEGLYLEGGLRRTFGAFFDPNFQITLEGLIAYVRGHDLYSVDPANIAGTGFSHYQVGLTAEYGLNNLLNISRRFGQWGIAGHLYYTDGIDNNLAATTELWGGAGITFRY